MAPLRALATLMLLPAAASLVTAAAIEAGPARVDVVRVEPGSCIVELDPCLAWHDPGDDPGPGDDNLYFYQNIRLISASAIVPGSPPLEVRLDLANSSVPHPLFQHSNALDATLDASTPPVVLEYADVDIDEHGIHPHHLNLREDGSVGPHTNHWDWNNDFYNYTHLHVPYTTYARSTDYLIEGSALFLICLDPFVPPEHACALKPHRALFYQLQEVLPNVVLGAEVHHAKVASAPQPGARDPPPAEGDGGPPGADGDAATTLQATEPAAGSASYASAAGEPPWRGRSEARAAGPAIPPPIAHAAHLAPATPWPLALALATLALPLLVYALYHRITGQRALAHAQRRRLHAMLQADPGQDVASIAKALGLSYKTAQHHVRVLHRSGLAVLTRQGRRTVVHLRGDADRAARSALLRHPTRDRIARLVAAEPGLEAARVAGRLGLSRTAAFTQVRALVEGGVLLRQGRRLYAAGDAPPGGAPPPALRLSIEEGPAPGSLLPAGPSAQP